MMTHSEPEAHNIESPGPIAGPLRTQYVSRITQIGPIWRKGVFVFFGKTRHGLYVVPVQRPCRDSLP